MSTNSNAYRFFCAILYINCKIIIRIRIHITECKTFSLTLQCRPQTKKTLQTIICDNQSSNRNLLSVCVNIDKCYALHMTMHFNYENILQCTPVKDIHFIMFEVIWSIIEMTFKHFFVIEFNVTGFLNAPFQNIYKCCLIHIL